MTATAIESRSCVLTLCQSPIGAYEPACGAAAGIRAPSIPGGTGKTRAGSQA